MAGCDSVSVKQTLQSRTISAGCGLDAPDLTVVFLIFNNTSKRQDGGILIGGRDWAEVRQPSLPAGGLFVCSQMVLMRFGHLFQGVVEEAYMELESKQRKIEGFYSDGTVDQVTVK